MFGAGAAEEVLDRVAGAVAARDAGLRAAALAVADALVDDAFVVGAGVRAHGWLRACTESSRGESSRLLRLGRLLAHHGSTREAVEAGRLSIGRAEVLAGAVTDARRGFYREQEAALLDAVISVARVEDVEVAVGHWCAIVDQDVAPAGEARHQKLVVSLRLDGGSVVTGDLDAPTTDALCAGLDAFATGPDPVEGPTPARTVSERRADALHDLCRAALHDQAGSDDDGVPQRRRERTTNLVVDLPTLAGRTGADVAGITATRDGRPIAVWAVERLLCDSWVAALVTDADGAVVDATERIADFTPTQRRLIAARDGGCVFPSCDAPPSWADVHHLHWRSNGGGRSLENGALLCRRHHTLVHLPENRRWTLERAAGGWQVTSPTGRVWNGRPHAPPPDGEYTPAA